MALGFYFSSDAFSPEQYDEAIGRLDAAGAGSPPGRTYHFALEAEDGIKVFDVWESQEAFEAFGATFDPDPRGARRRPRRADGLPGPQHHPGLTGTHDAARR